jgi:hypothetical protein
VISDVVDDIVDVEGIVRELRKNPESVVISDVVDMNRNALRADVGV